MLVNIFFYPIQIIRIILLLAPKSYLQILNIVVYLFGPSIGSSIKKIFIRFTDFRLLSKYLDGEEILEFGSGSSTIFFITNKKLCRSLVTFEEDIGYFPKIFGKQSNFYKVIGKSGPGSYLNIEGSQFKNSCTFIQKASVIYIDGPATEFLPKFNSVAPNLDVINCDVTGKVIIIDCRTFTVSLLASKLNQTHIFLPSKSFLFEINKNGNKIPYFDSSMNRYRLVEKQLTRCSVFLPLNYLPDKDLNLI